MKLTLIDYNNIDWNMKSLYILILFAASICFTGCYEIMEAALEGTDSYLDAQIAAQRRQIAADQERRRRALEDLDIAMKMFQIKLELAEARLQARRVAALEKLVDSMVYVNEARKYHHPDCQILKVSTVKIITEVTVAQTIYTACSQCLQ